MNGFCSICGEYTEGTRHDCPASIPVRSVPVAPVGSAQLPVFARPVLPPQEKKRRTSGALRKAGQGRRPN